MYDTYPKGRSVADIPIGSLKGKNIFQIIVNYPESPPQYGGLMKGHRYYDILIQ